ncbi:MAG: hypothetical protein NT030_03440 [Candidatus Saganbacteria bacterium]|nr:hypothetical protein [Candidatus Saganbacteria bacterium]
MRRRDIVDLTARSRKSMAMKINMVDKLKNRKGMGINLPEAIPKVYAIVRQISGCMFNK